MNNNLDEIEALLTKFFNGDNAKVWLWLTLPNPLLGNVRPLTMVLLGRSEKLLKHIKNCLEGNFP